MAFGWKTGKPRVRVLLLSIPAQNRFNNLHWLIHSADSGKLSEVWAVTLSSDGQYLAGTTSDGHIKIWDLFDSATQIRDFETKGSFGMCVDLVRP
jgi:superkiller protein 8